MSRHCYLETRFLVSDQIADTMFGMDWLRKHHCRISFGTGAMFVGRRRFQFVKGDGGLWCRRITVAKETTLPNIWTMVAGQAIPEAHPTLVLQNNQTRVRFLDLRGETALLATADVSSTLHQVEAETVGERDGTSRHAFLTDELMACISEGDLPETRVRLERCAESRQHGNADALSQKSCLQCGQERPGPCRQRPQKATSNVTETGNGGNLVVEQIWDPVLCTEETAPTMEGCDKVYCHQRGQPLVQEDLIRRQETGSEEQVVVPTSQRKGNLGLAHANFTGGYLEARRFKHRVGLRANWAGWARNVKRYDERCYQRCQYRRWPPPERQSIHADYIKERLQKARDLGKAADMRIRPVSYKKDDIVYFVSPRRYVGRSRKWDRHFTGPYRVVQQFRPVNYIVQRSARAKPYRIHVDKRRLCHHDTSESVPRTVASEGEHTRQEARPATTGHWKRSTGRAEGAAVRKWDRHFTGPYRVVQQCGPVNYIAQRSARAKPFRIHVDKLRLCHSDTTESVPRTVASHREYTCQGATLATTGRWTRNAGTAEHAAAPKWDRHFTGPYRVVQQCG